MRRVARKERRQIASLVLVAIVAALLLPLGASAPAPRLVARPSARLHDRRHQSEARPVASARRVAVSRDAALVAAALVTAAFALLGLLHLVDLRRPAWTSALLAVQRGPPSLR